MYSVPSPDQDQLLDQYRNRLLGCVYDRLAGQLLWRRIDSS